MRHYAVYRLQVFDNKLTPAQIRNCARYRPFKEVDPPMFFEMKVQRCTKKLPKAQNAEKWREGIEERNEMQTIE